MLQLVNYRLRVTLTDSRALTGQMLAYDKHMNLVLAGPSSLFVGSVTLRCGKCYRLRGISYTAQEKERVCLFVVKWRRTVLIRMCEQDGRTIRSRRRTTGNQADSGSRHSQRRIHRFIERTSSIPLILYVPTLLQVEGPPPAPKEDPTAGVCSSPSQTNAVVDLFLIACTWSWKSNGSRQRSSQHASLVLSSRLILSCRLYVTCL